MKKHILYNTITNKLGISYTGNYTDNYPKGKLKPYEIELEIVTLPIPEHDKNTHKAVPLPYVANIEARTYTRGWEIVPLTEQELATREWVYPNYEFRIVCPKQLGEQYPAMYVHFMMEELPIEKHPTNENLRVIYINTILPQHSDLIMQLQEVVDVEARPEVLNPVDVIL